MVARTHVLQMLIMHRRTDGRIRSIWQHHRFERNLEKRVNAAMNTWIEVTNACAENVRRLRSINEQRSELEARVAVLTKERDGVSSQLATSRHELEGVRRELTEAREEQVRRRLVTALTPAHAALVRAPARESCLATRR